MKDVIDQTNEYKLSGIITDKIYIFKKVRCERDDYIDMMCKDYFFHAWKTFDRGNFRYII